MKKYLKITGYVVGGILLGLYAIFLFVLPNAINLNDYKPQIETLILNNSGYKVDLGNLKLYTTPLLEVGIKTDGIEAKLSDDSSALRTDKIKAKVFVPSLVWRQVLVTGVNIDNPYLNAEIIDNEQYKIVRNYENFVNDRRKDKLANPEKYQKVEDTSSSFDISKIIITVPSVKLNNYVVNIDDTKEKHNLTLNGKCLKLAYHNGKTAKLKTNTQLLSDNQPNINANLDLDTFLPKFEPKPKEEEDLEAVYAIPFVNPVETYRKYELKSNIDSKLKIRKTKKYIKINGHTNIEDTTLKIANLQLPVSYLRWKSSGTKSNIDLKLYVTDKEHFKLAGIVDYGKNFYTDLMLKSTTIHLDSLLNITKAYLDSIHINNDLKNMTAQGYIFADAKIKIKKDNIDSNGIVVARRGYISNSSKGILFKDLNANLLFNEKEFNIKNTHVFINDKPLYVSGKIKDDSSVNLIIDGQQIPLTGVYAAFAPKHIKNKYILKSGFITINGKITGELKNILTLLKVQVDNFVLYDKDGEFILTNKNLNLGFGKFAQNMRGNVHNKYFVINFPKRHSVIKNNDLKLSLENDKITLTPTELLFNKKSTITLSGGITEIFNKMNAALYAKGALASSDLADVLLKTAIPYFDIKGSLPLRAKCEIKGSDLKATLQVAANPQNYVTPVNMYDFVGRQTILQAYIEKDKNTIKISKTGLFTKNYLGELSNNLSQNMKGTKEIVKIRGIISNLNTQPFISLIKINLPENMDGSICILKKSRFSVNGHLQIFGKPQSPKITGKITIKKFNIPELYTRMGRIVIDLTTNRILAKADHINANQNNLNILAISDWNKIKDLTFTDVRIFSRFIDVNKILEVPKAGEKAFPGSAKSVRNDQGERPDNPVKILKGSLRLQKIVMDKIIVNDTSSSLRMHNSTIYLNDLKTSPLGGFVSGDVSYHILDAFISAKISGKNFDVEKVLQDLLNMNDMISGKANFIADITLKGTAITEQLKTLKGYVDFNIKDGQLGPFGKIENFLMAENIRENAFFSSAIGSIITNIVTFDTSRYNSLFGHLTFNDGYAFLAPIKSQGNVMSMYISGKVGLIDNSAEMIVRGKLASAFSDKLGPLANINPINLVKNTPGLNVVAVKAFTLFCEEVSQEEMDALPELGEGKSDENATKFQIRLKGDTRKPLKMIKSFKWLALNSDIESAQHFVDTIPTPEAGEENMSVEELIQLRQQQAELKAHDKKAKQEAREAKKPINIIKNKIKKSSENK